MHGDPDLVVTDSGWLERVESRQPVLWLPLERRGKEIASSQQRVVVGGRSGAITVLDFPGKIGCSLVEHAE
jgi:hypothetical protein